MRRRRSRTVDQRPDSLPRSLVATTRRRGMIPSRAWLLCRRASTCTLLTLAGRVRYALLTNGLGSARSLPPARTVRRARRREAYPRFVDALANPPAIPVHSQRSRELASAKGGRSAATFVPRPLVARHDKRGRPLLHLERPWVKAQLHNPGLPPGPVTFSLTIYLVQYTEYNSRSARVQRQATAPSCSTCCSTDARTGC
jgi:hypothetical protein